MFEDKEEMGKLSKTSGKGMDASQSPGKALISDKQDIISKSEEKDGCMDVDPDTFICGRKIYLSSS